MILAAAVLTAAISIEVDLVALFKGARAAETSSVTCGISTVGYRFVGKAGQKFRYAGDTYRVPVEGSIELIAAPRRTTYAYNGRSLPLEVWPRDQFGFREVPLPTSTN